MVAIVQDKAAEKRAKRHVDSLVQDLHTSYLGILPYLERQGDLLAWQVAINRIETNQLSRMRIENVVFFRQSKARLAEAIARRAEQSQNHPPTVKFGKSVFARHT